MSVPRAQSHAAPPSSRKRKRPPSPPAAPFYPFLPLLDSHPPLRHHLSPTATPHFSRSTTLYLTQAILQHHFSLSISLPAPHLVPTIPNRVQYLRWAFSLLPTPPPTALDICTGPSCIYPLLSTRLFPNTSFIATDSDPIAISLAHENLRQNSICSVTLIHTNSQTLLPPQIHSHRPHLVICNPPFHDTPPSTTSEHAKAGTDAQLATPGGELAFLRMLAAESTTLSSVHYFTSLIGRKRDLAPVLACLRSKAVRARAAFKVELNTGGRTVRWAVAWSFGEERSNVCIIQGGKWRVVIGVECARKYANQLECTDIRAVFEQAAVEVGGSILDEGGIRMEGGLLQIIMEEGENWGLFRATLKVMEKGEMEQVGLATVVKNLSDKVRRILDEF